MSTAVELTVVGCSGSISGPDSAASSYLVRAPVRGPHLRPGARPRPGGDGRALPPPRPAATSDAIALSHLHPDHCLDLCAFYVAARYSPTAPWPRIPLLGPTGTARAAGRRLRRARRGRPAEPGPRHRRAVRAPDWAPSQQARAVPARHRPGRPPRRDLRGARHRGRAARAAAWSSAGTPAPARRWSSWRPGRDLLLAEAAFLDGPGNPPGLHLTGRDAAEAARRAGVGRAGADPHPAVARPRTRCWPRPGRTSTAPSRWPSTGAAWTIGPR